MSSVLSHAYARLPLVHQGATNVGPNKIEAPSAASVVSRGDLVCMPHLSPLTSSRKLSQAGAQSIPLLSAAQKLQAALDGAGAEKLRPEHERTRARSRMDSHAQRKQEEAAEAANAGGAAVGVDKWIRMDKVDPHALSGLRLDRLMDGKNDRDRLRRRSARSSVSSAAPAGVSQNVHVEQHPAPAFGSAASRWDASLREEKHTRAAEGPGAVYDVADAFPGSVQQAARGPGTKLGKAQALSLYEVQEKRSRGLPGPGEDQPPFGFSALKTSGAGGFSRSQPSGFLDRHLCSVGDNPAPGACQPEGGFSTLATAGGEFNRNRSKTFIEQHIHEMKVGGC